MKRVVEIICDFQENFGSYSDEGHINDHQPKETFLSIQKAIASCGYNCHLFGGVPKLLDLYNHKDLIEQYKDHIFLNLSDGMSQRYSRVQIPVLCDLLGFSYSGADPFTVALTSNKYYSKLAVEKLGIPTTPAITATKTDMPERYILDEIRYPIIIKPNCEGSSLGISDKSVCHDEEQMLLRVREQLEIFDEILIEGFVPGYDITDFIIGNPGEYSLNETLIGLHGGKIVSGNEVMGSDDYLRLENSYIKTTGYLNEATDLKIKEYTKTIVSALNIHDISRIDYRVKETGEISFLEINTVPAIHRRTQAGCLCKENDISFEQFLGFYVEAVINRLTHVKG